MTTRNRTADFSDYNEYIAMKRRFQTIKLGADVVKALGEVGKAMDELALLIGSDDAEWLHTLDNRVAEIFFEVRDKFRPMADNFIAPKIKSGEFNLNEFLDQINRETGISNA